MDQVEVREVVSHAHSAMRHERAADAAYDTETEERFEACRDWLASAEESGYRPNGRNAFAPWYAGIVLQFEGDAPGERDMRARLRIALALDEGQEFDDGWTQAFNWAMGRPDRDRSSEPAGSDVSPLKAWQKWLAAYDRLPPVEDLLDQTAGDKSMALNVASHLANIAADIRRRTK